MRFTNADVPVSMYVTDDTGTLVNADSTPVLTIYGPNGSSTPTIANPSTGEYTASFTPDVAGVWVGTFAATVDGIDYVTVTRWTVHDGDAEAARTGFPVGLSSWVPTV